MAKTEVAETVAVSADIIGRLAKGLEDLAENSRNPLKQATILETVPDTPWTPKDGAARVKAKSKFYQNGTMCDDARMTNEEISLFNQLKPGRYNHKKWEVAKGKKKGIDFRFPDKTIEQRIERTATAPNLAAMLRLVVTEQEVQMARKRSGNFDEDDDE